METATQDAVTAQELATLLEQAREKLESLVRDLRAVDAELEDLAPARQQHQLLQEACTSLGKLGELGGAKLFWSDGAGDEQLGRARNRVEAFGKRIAGIEDRRRAVIEELERQQEHTYLLEDDVFEALEEEESRKYEWVVEREPEVVTSPVPIIGWSRGGEEERRFRKSMASALLVALVIAVVLPMIDLPERLLAEVADVPERVVTLMMQERPQPPTPVQVRPKEPQKLVEEKPVEKPEPRVAMKPTPEAQPEEAPVPQGILAFRESLAVKDTPSVGLGLQARISSDSGAAARPERAMLTTNAPGSSGGIKLASLSRNFGTGGGNQPMQGAALTQASSAITAIGPGDRPLSGGPGLARTDEEIQIVFDRYKSALYRLYNRELRNDPTLQGQMVLRLTIEPDGSVSFCKLHTTDMNAPDLVVQVVDRVKGFDFGAKEVPAITIVYPIDFLPAA